MNPFVLLSIEYNRWCLESTVNEKTYLFCAYGPEDKLINNFGRSTIHIEPIFPKDEYKEDRLVYIAFECEQIHDETFDTLPISPMMLNKWDINRPLPFLWFLTGPEEDARDTKSITDSKIATFPECVRLAMGLLSDEFSLH